MEWHATYLRLEAASPNEVAQHKWYHAKGNTWVVFRHACGVGRVDRTLFLDHGGHIGGTEGKCGCIVTVPKAWWARWQAMSELERRVWSVREEVARVE